MTGLIHIYYGNGKGKTTAAAGQVMRARGRGYKIAWIQYCKDTRKNPSGELIMLKKNTVSIYEFAPRIPLFDSTVRLRDIKHDCKKSLSLIKKIFKQTKYNLIVLDELNVALTEKFINIKELLTVLKSKPAAMHVIITGRGKHSLLCAYADLVTEMKEIKHHFKAGIKAQKGIEY